LTTRNRLGCSVDRTQSEKRLRQASFLERISFENTPSFLRYPKFLKPLFYLVDTFNQDNGGLNKNSLNRRWMASTSDEDNTTRRTTDDFTTGLGQSGDGDGLTIPSAPVIESWVASTQNWMNARFADWNPEPANRGLRDRQRLLHMERLAPRPARSSLPPLPRSGRTGPARRRHRRGFFQQAGIASRHPVRHSATGVIRTGEKSFEPIWVGEKLSLASPTNSISRTRGSAWCRHGWSENRPRPFVRPHPVVRKVYREIQLELAQWSRTLGSVLPRWSSRISPRDSSRSSWPGSPWRRR